MSPELRTRAWNLDRTAPALVAAFALALIWLGTGPFKLGASDWDDTMYVEMAASGEFRWAIRNRYTHIWGLRVVQELVEPRATAAALWPTLMVAALAVASFFVGRRCGGTACGLLSMVLVVLFPPVLKYLAVPHVDLTLALFGMLTLLGAVSAVEIESPARSRAWAIASGLCCFLALESKETALVLPPLVLYLLSGTRRSRLHVYGEWLAGLALGWCVLMALDAAFMEPGQRWSSDLRDYFPRGGQSHGGSDAAAPQKVKLERELLSELSKTAYAAFTWTGLAGAAWGFRRNRWVKALALWGIGTLVFTALIAWRSWTIDGRDRYLLCIGVALAPPGAAWVVELWRRPRENARENLIWLLPLLLSLSAMAIWGVWVLYFGQAGKPEQSAAFFIAPVAMLLLFIAPWLSGGRILPAVAALLLLAISALASIGQARDNVAKERRHIAPWVELARVADAANAQIAVWQSRKLNAVRVRSRLHAVSSRPVAELAVRVVEDPGEARADEWLFTGSERSKALEQAGWVRVASVSADRQPWSAYRRAGTSPKPPNALQ
jgi:hypothetical protein